MSESDKSNSDVPGVIALPPIIYLAFVAGGVALELLWRTHLVTTSFPLRVGLGVSLALLGLAIAKSAQGQFRRAKTPVNPARPAAALVTEGPFRFSRNPMYLALTLVYGGIAFGANSAWLVGLLLPLLAVMHYGVIFREEAYLERKFGDAYRHYRKSVRRWF